MAEAEYLTDTVTLYEGDCLDVLPTLPKGSVDAVITDPPYGCGYTTNHESPWMGTQIEGDGDTKLRDHIVKWAVANGLPWACFGSPKIVRPSGWRGVLVWDKGPSSGMGDLSFPWKPSWEEIYIGGHGWTGKRSEGVLKGHVQHTHVSHGRCHPNQKPVSLIRKLIAKAPGETILDPFAGSGTTAVGAMLENRRCIVIERDPGYCEIIRKRVRDASGVAPGTLFHGVANLFDN